MATNDPLLAAVQETVELVIQRGIEIKPIADGYLIRVASRETVEAVDASGDSARGRSW